MARAVARAAAELIDAGHRAPLLLRPRRRQMRVEAQQRARARVVVDHPLGQLLWSRPWLGRAVMLLRL